MHRLTRYISEKISPEPYTAACCAVWCFDARFGKLARLFETYQPGPVDFVAVAGGAKALGDGGASAAYVLEQVAASLRLHATREIALMVHEDCGAYGRKFASADEMRDFYIAELEKASEVVRTLLGARAVPVRKIFADFQGLWEVRA